MANDKDPLGTRIKGYEALTTDRRAFRGQPFAIRLDGKSFSTYTNGLKRPYDERLSNLMIEVTIDLVAEFGALVGYTQSDEITLGFYLPSGSESEYPFGGYFQKLESLTAAYTSAEFIDQRPIYLPGWKETELPIFDSRAFVVPNLQELYHVFLWRQQDSVKNSITMAAQSVYSHKQLQGKGSAEKQDMLFEKGINYHAYPVDTQRVHG